MKSPYELDLHESVEIDGWIITAVPGGWIYRHSNEPVAQFVPLPYEEPEKVAEVVNPEDQAFKDSIVHYINSTLAGKGNDTEGNRLIRQLLRNAHS